VKKAENAKRREFKLSAFSGSPLAASVRGDQIGSPFVTLLEHFSKLRA
jgi:hypothetical protein